MNALKLTLLLVKSINWQKTKNEKRWVNLRKVYLHPSLPPLNSTCMKRAFALGRIWLWWSIKIVQAHEKHIKISFDGCVVHLEFVEFQILMINFNVDVYCNSWQRSIFGFRNRTPFFNSSQVALSDRMDNWVARQHTLLVKVSFLLVSRFGCFTLGE